MSKSVVETLCELVAIPSVNPMGRDLTGPEFFEYRVTDYLERRFRDLGLPYQRQSIEPKRDNIVAMIEGTPSLREGGRLVMLEAHQDTVPVDGMTIDPWTPAIRNDRVYGRGACDIKGGMAAMLSVVEQLVNDSPPQMPTLVMACTVNEEHGYSGAKELCELWDAPDSIIPRRPDAAIVAEPTGLQVVVAHKGTLRWRCRALGKAVHSSQPDLGRNAIYSMAGVLNALATYQQQEVARRGVHALCGPGSLSVGTIQGGLSVNTVPDECVIEVDRRIIPGENDEDAYRSIIEFVAARNPSADVVHDPPFMQGNALSDADNGDLADALVAAATACGHTCEKIGVPYGTDASQIAAAGVPTVVFGPGSIDQAHTADEWLAINQLESAVEILFRFLTAEAC